MQKPQKEPDGLTSEFEKLMNEFGVLLKRSNARVKRLNSGSMTKAEKTALNKEVKEDDQLRKAITKKLKDYKKKNT